MVLISSTAEHPPQIARRVGPFIPIRGSSVLSRRTVSTHDGSLGRDPASNAPANSRRAMCVAISQSRWAPVELMITGRPRQPPLWVGRVKPRCGTGPSEASASRPSQSRPGRLGRGDGVLHTGSHIRCRRVQGGTAPHRKAFISRRWPAASTSSNGASPDPRPVQIASCCPRIGRNRLTH